MLYLSLKTKHCTILIFKIKHTSGYISERIVDIGQGMLKSLTKTKITLVSVQSSKG